jgi:hypothetical protein
MTKQKDKGLRYLFGVKSLLLYSNITSACSKGSYPILLFASFYLSFVGK